jgi:hypothetical protein
MAKAAACSLCATIRIRYKQKLFGILKRFPPIRAGWPESVTLVMPDALQDHLLEKSDLQYTFMRWSSYF